MTAATTATPTALHVDHAACADCAALCDECEGTGSVETEDYYCCDEEYPCGFTEIDCPDCGGSGLAADARYAAEEALAALAARAKGVTK